MILSVYIIFISFSRCDRALEEWRQFHGDLNDLTEWTAQAEALLIQAQTPGGGLDLEKAQHHQQVYETFHVFYLHNPAQHNPAQRTMISLHPFTLSYSSFKPFSCVR